MKHHLLFEAPVASLLTAKVHVFSYSVFFTVPGAGDEESACPGDTPVQIQQKRKAFMSETGQEPDRFLDRIIFASTFNDITIWDS